MGCNFKRNRWDKLSNILLFAAANYAVVLFFFCEVFTVVDLIGTFLDETFLWPNLLTPKGSLVHHFLKVFCGLQLVQVFDVVEKHMISSYGADF